MGTILCYTVGCDLSHPTLPSIFLAGPIERRKVGVRPSLLRWRDEAEAFLLKEAPFTFCVYNPEWDTKPDGWSYEMQVEWEVTALQKATCVLCWIPRKLPELPAFTTNIEVGEWLHSPKLIVGAPPEAPHTRYIKFRRELLGLSWCTTLEACCAAAINFPKEGKS